MCLFNYKLELEIIESIWEFILARRKHKRFYRYRCSITDKEYKVTREVDNPDDLFSIEAYYELHPEDEDRPESVLAEIAIEKENEEEESAGNSLFDELSQFDVSGKPRS